MIFHKNNKSVKVCRCYTLMELLVVMAIMTILMAISANLGIKSKKAVVGQYKKLVSAIPIQVDSQQGKKEVFVSKIPANVQDDKISVLKTPQVTAETIKKTNMAAASKTSSKHTSDQVAEQPQQAVQEPEMISFPEPAGITPGKTKVTVFDKDDPLNESFARFLYQKGSSVSLKEYRQLWAFDVEALKKEKKIKLERGIGVPLFSQYLRKKTIFETSPYRTYMLRKRMLLASRQLFNPKESTLKYKTFAEKNFCLLPKGEHIRITSVDGRVYSGKYNGKVRKQVSIKLDNPNINIQLPLEQIPADQHWKFDLKARNAKREKFVKLALAKEKEFEEKQNEYIRKILAAEFIMLKEEPGMKKLW